MDGYSSAFIAFEWKNLGGASYATAYSAFFARNRRRLGIIAARTFARLILNGSRYTAQGTSKVLLNRRQASCRLDAEADKHFSLFGPHVYAPSPRDQEWGSEPGELD
mgnify:CR=1 FL=1